MKKVLFLANHFVTLYNFRRELIEQLVKEGTQVTLSLPASEDNEFFKRMGCKVVETNIERRGMNPLREFELLCEYVRLINAEKPNVIFAYTIKCNIYGAIAARITRHRIICNITGMGEMMNHGSVRKVLAHMLYRVSVRHSHKVFFQNTADMEYFRVNHLVKPGRFELIPGSGVNLESFSPTDMTFDTETRFIFAGRVMKLKGIDEYLAAAKTIRAERNDVRFYVAGFTEEDYYKDLLEKYACGGIIDYLGFRKDIKDWIRYCHCTILPSIAGEGISNALLESAASCRALIASRIPGCIEVIDEGVNGFLFTPGDAEDLTVAIRKFLALTNEEKAQFGRKGREKVESHFDRGIVIRKYLSELDSACAKR